MSDERTAEGQIQRGGAAPGLPRSEGVDGPSRRRFIQLVGAAGGAAALSTLAAACGSGAEGGGAADASSGPPEPATDLEIVNYALFLEYLEEDFYKQVIESGEISDPPQLVQLIRNIRKNETEHADALAGVAEQLGGVPVARPKTKFGPIIAAGREQILEVASVLENTGAAAYLGQAPRIENSRLLETALAIHTVEARHAASINEYAGFGFQEGDRLKGSVPDGAFGKPMTREEVLSEAAIFVKA